MVSQPVKYAGIAQLVEQHLCKLKVVGSNPATSSISKLGKTIMNQQILKNLYILGKISGDEYAERTAYNYAEPFYPKISAMLGNMRFHGEGRLKRRIAAVVLALAQSPHKQEPVFKETQDLHGNEAVLVTYKGADGGERETFISNVLTPYDLYQKVCKDIELTFRV